MFTLKIETSGAAFDVDKGYEIARILEEVAEAIAYGASYGTVQDSNGNTVGSFNVR